MRVLNSLTYLIMTATAVCVVAVQAQQSSPPMIVVQPAGATVTAPATPPTTSSSENAVANAIKTLEQVKAANEATLKKQEAMLQQLDELQKAAEQLKIFSKRV